MTTLLNWIGYQLVMHGPLSLTGSATNPIGRWCLPRAGGHAYPQNTTQEKT